jgi:hypothetical protein
MYVLGLISIINPRTKISINAKVNFFIPYPPPYALFIFILQIILRYQKFDIIWY